jgi:hypothetical protein
LSVLGRNRELLLYPTDIIIKVSNNNSWTPMGRVMQIKIDAYGINTWNAF